MYITEIEKLFTVKHKVRLQVRLLKFIFCKRQKLLK